MTPESNRTKPRLRFASDEGTEATREKPKNQGQKASDKFVDAESTVPMKKVLALERSTNAQTGNTMARLRFGEEGQTDTASRKPPRNASMTAQKFARAESKAPSKKGSAIERATDANTGNTVARLRFGEPRQPSGKLMDALPRAPAKLLYKPANQQNDAGNDGDVGNVGVDAARSARGLGESAFQTAQNQARRTQKLRPYRRLERAEARLDRANARVPQRKAAQNHQGSNPLSRWRQRQAVQQGYAARAAQNAGARTTEKVAERISQTFRKNKKSLMVGGLIFLMFAMVMNSLSSCSPLVQSGFQAIVISTYPAEDADLLAAERMYANMEKELQTMLDSYEHDHDYDEYNFDLDEIWHDPHALMAILSAWYGGEVWTADQVYGTLEMLFAQQYKLTETVTKEIRYRQEERTGHYTYTDPATGEKELREYTYTVDVPYDYFICNVLLINENLSHLPVYIMSEERVGMYAMYISTLGNKPDLFSGNRYASKLETYTDYEIPEEALEDPAFAALIADAEKYLGYPYVWGGSKPSTSFDCSGFVSWVYTQTGVCNTGRLGATSLYGVCTPITPEEARPGDVEQPDAQGNPPIAMESLNKQLSFFTREEAHSFTLQALRELGVSVTPYISQTYALDATQMATLTTRLADDPWYHYRNDAAYLPWAEGFLGAYRVDILFLQEGVNVQSRYSPLSDRFIGHVLGEPMEAHAIIGQEGLIALEWMGAIRPQSQYSERQVLSLDDALLSLKRFFDDFILTDEYIVKEIYPTYFLRVADKTSGFPDSLTLVWCFDIVVMVTDSITQDSWLEGMLLALDAETGKEVR